MRSPFDEARYKTLLSGLEISEVRLSELERTKRIDAEYYRPSFLALLKIQAENSKTTKALIDVCEKIDVGFVGSMVHAYSDEMGIPLLQTQNIKQFFIDASNLKYIQSWFHAELGKSQIFPGDVLIARSGSIGNAAVVTKSDLQPLNSSDIIIIRPKGLNEYYLCAYINSKFGQIQIERLSSGGVQGHINLGALETITTPIPSLEFQKQIEKTVKAAHTKLEQSKSLYAQAEAILLDELGLKDLDLSDSLFNIRKFSEVQQVDRIDSEHFNKKYERLEGKLKSYPSGFETIGNLCLPPINGAEVREYVEQGTPYLRVGDLRQLDISENTVVYIADESAHEVREKVSLQEGDVLVTRSGSLGISSVITKKWESSITSSHLIRLRLKNKTLDPYYLALFMNTTAGAEQVRKRSNGGIQPEINQPSLKNIIVPLLLKKEQTRIRQMIIRSHVTRDESKHLLELAKQAIETAIEKGEAAGLKALEEEKITIVES